MAAALSIRLPAGASEDLHGFGDTAVTPSVVASHTFGPHEVHGSLGLELNADDAERDRARYALGASLRPFDRVAFLLDVLGSSSFTEDIFDLRAPAGHRFPQQAFGAIGIVAGSATRIVALVPRSDVVDLALGLKVHPCETLIGFASVIVPMTRDGLRADLMPAVGLETSF